MFNRICEIFATLLSYPNDKLLLECQQAQKLVEKYYPSVSDILKKFTDFVTETALTQVEEIYCRIFEVQAITTLDVGYLLFGDDYKRGELLVNLNKEHSKVNNDCSNELSDHLPNLLRLVTKTKDEEFKNDLIYLIIKPALKKIINEFEEINIGRKNKIYIKHHKTLIPLCQQCINYKYLFESLLMILNAEFTNDINYDFNDESQINFVNELEMLD